MFIRGPKFSRAPLNFRLENWTPVHAPSRIPLYPPRQYGSQAADFLSKLDLDTQEQGVLALECGYLLGPDGWVATSKRHLSREFSWFGRHVDQMPRPARWYRVNRIKSACLLLSSDWANVNFSHFLLDGPARLDLLLRAGYKLADIDWFFCAPFNKKCENHLARLGIPLEQCVFSRTRAVRADIVFAPSFPGTRRNPSRWVVQFLPQRFSTQAAEPYRKL